MLEVKLFTRQEVERLLTMESAIAAVERAFAQQAEGKAVMPPKVYLDVPGGVGDFRAMPGYIDEIAGIKWVSVFPDNAKRNLPTVMATIILSDPETGRPLAIMDGTYITETRTGAAGGVAARYLARKDSATAGLVGAGIQAEAQLLALKIVLPSLNRVKVFDINVEAARKYAASMGKRLGMNIDIARTAEEAADADIVVTTTPSRSPVIKGQVKPGTHINAIGADAKGKQELDPVILAKAKIVVDEIEQASHSGEINVPLSAGLLRLTDVYGTLGEVISGAKKGRENDAEITVFDSTGLAIQDIACAKLVYLKAADKSCAAVGLSG